MTDFCCTMSTKAAIPGVNNAVEKLQELGKIYRAKYSLIFTYYYFLNNYLYHFIAVTFTVYSEFYRAA